MHILSYTKFVIVDMIVFVFVFYFSHIAYIVAYKESYMIGQNSDVNYLRMYPLWRSFCPKKRSFLWNGACRLSFV